MKELISEIVKNAIGRDVEIFIPEQEGFGHYSTAVALRVAKELKGDPVALAEEFAARIREKTPKDFFDRVEVAAPGFVNFWISQETIQNGLVHVVEEKNYGIPDLFRGKRIMIEYTDPNPFKQFHIGHLMTNTIGESIARLCEAVGAEVVRVNYQGDVGVHVASSIWGMTKLLGEMPSESAALNEKMAFLGRAYASGALAYKDDVAAKTEIDALNKKIYERSDAAVNTLYDKGRQWSLDYFEGIYARLGTKFAHYFFESEIGPDGVAIVRAHPDVFVKSEGAIVFLGEQYGLHNRVFITALGLPTYEAKELGLNKLKFDLYHPDISLIVTGNEINDYFRVLLKAMELALPDAASRTRHIGHGMLRLPGGKMSSRTGDVITAESLLHEIGRAVSAKLNEREGFTESERETIKEQVSLAAIRYSILKQGIGKDIVFDLASSVAFHGDSGPYLQYAFARIEGVKRKAPADLPKANFKNIKTERELLMARIVFEFPDIVRECAEHFSANRLAEYLYGLANQVNALYEEEPILKDENTMRMSDRLALIDAAGKILKKGLNLLGIETLERI